jgi:hypothetical protein
MSEAANWEVDINLEGQKAWDGVGGGPPEIPPGNYALELTDVQRGTSNAGKPVLKVDFTVVSEGASLGKKFQRSYSLTEKALGRIANLLRACGARLDKIRQEDMLGRIIEAEIVHTEGQVRFGTDGQPLPARLFLDVINERAIEEEAPPAPAPAPVAAAPAAVAAKGGVRRAVGPATARS